MGWIGFDGEHTMDGHTVEGMAAEYIRERMAGEQGSTWNRACLERMAAFQPDASDPQATVKRQIACDCAKAIEAIELGRFVEAWGHFKMNEPFQRWEWQRP